MNKKRVIKGIVGKMCGKGGPGFAKLSKTVIDSPSALKPGVQTTMDAYQIPRPKFEKTKAPSGPIQKNVGGLEVRPSYITGNNQPTGFRGPLKETAKPVSPMQKPLKNDILHRNIVDKSLPFNKIR